jgi:tetratricopeptide (TPR) repeat protein
MDCPSKESPIASLLGASRLSSLCAVALLAGLTVCIGCAGGPAMFLSARDSDLRDSTKAIETARDDAQRAKAYSSRATAYSEKVRYSRLLKLISDDEYERLFARAIKDHDQAIALNSASAEVYFNRAQTYYDRGSLDLIYATNPFEGKPRNNTWLHAAALDFEKATEKDPQNSLAFDRLGLTYESNGEADKAIQAYTQEMALDRHLGQSRLADAYCIIGYEQQLQKDLDAAVAAYEKSIEFGVADDKSCPIEPFAAMAAIYTTETRQYDKAWEMVHRAQKVGRRIGSDVIDRLKKDSARPN